MDGHFVPNLTMGPAIVKSLRRVTRLPLEAHLMVEEPARFVDAFIQAGIDLLILHQEVLPDPRPVLQLIHEAGKKVGLAVKPETPVEVLEPFLPNLDLALCMTVHPGFSGQAFLPESPERIAQLRRLIDRLHPGCDLEVDGGIDERTAPIAVRAGANVLVAATAVFGAKEGPGAAVRALLAHA
jgi:ribulose-phosphate 3-epimerase